MKICREITTPNVENSEEKQSGQTNFRSVLLFIPQSQSLRIMEGFTGLK